MNYLGLVGLLALSGEAGGPPAQAAGQIADLGGGALMAAFGILAALRERDRSGEGQLVDVSMADGALSWLAMVAAVALRDGRGAARGGRRAGRARCSATGPTRAPTGTSRSARSSRSSGRRGAAGSGART
jgi:crotonobetainyl-CoA:carnitine CoA-transferase CaiB-like acyl-CoA transferase